MPEERVDRAPAAAVSPFGSRLAALVAVRESQIVLGLDPDPARLWPEAHAAADRAGDGSPASRAAAAVAAHCRAAIIAAGPACVAVKPQVACFERLGAPGWRALADVAEAAREAGLLVLADGKRGDIDVSAAAYGQAFFGTTPTPFGDVGGLGADALTVSPFLGLDSLQPLLDGARAASGGLFVLVRTSNPGAADFQDPPDTEDTLSERVAAAVARLGQTPTEPGEPADVGAVVGATAPERLARMRELMPDAPFLLPGIGAQGGRVEDLAPAFAPGPAHALVSASRGIVAAHERSKAAPAAAARAEAERLRELAWGLSRR
jgi:orotidine-5'-phosphate decarboxylase